MLALSGVTADSSGGTADLSGGTADKPPDEWLVDATLCLAATFGCGRVAEGLGGLLAAGSAMALRNPLAKRFSSARRVFLVQTMEWGLKFRAWVESSLGLGV